MEKLSLEQAKANINKLQMEVVQAANEIIIERLEVYLQKSLNDPSAKRGFFFTLYVTLKGDYLATSNIANIIYEEHVGGVIIPFFELLNDLIYGHRPEYIFCRELTDDSIMEEQTNEAKHLAILSMGILIKEEVKNWMMDKIQKKLITSREIQVLLQRYQDLINH